MYTDNGLFKSIKCVFLDAGWDNLGNVFVYNTDTYQYKAIVNADKIKLTTFLDKKEINIEIPVITNDHKKLIQACRVTFNHMKEQLKAE